jgi:splicing factor 3B subunit 1
MRRAELEREEQRVKRAIQKQQEEGVGPDGQELKAIEAPDETPRGRRWDVEEPERPAAIKDVDMSDGTGKARGGEWDDASTQGKDAVAVVPKKKRSRWDETPVATPAGGAAGPGETPKRSRWDQTPVGGVMATPRAGGMMPFGMMTPAAGMGGEGFGMGGGQLVDPRNRYLSDEELNTMLPSEGYEIVEPPAGYAPIRTPARKLQETPMAMSGGGFVMQEDAASASMLGLTQELPTEIEGVGDLQFFKQEDAQYFAKVRFVLCFVLARAD